MDGRRTLAAEDLLAAMRALGLDQYHDVLRDYVIKYREVRVAFASVTIGTRFGPQLTMCVYFVGQNDAAQMNRSDRSATDKRRRDD